MLLSISLVCTCCNSFLSRKHLLNEKSWWSTTQQFVKPMLLLYPEAVCHLVAYYNPGD